MQKEFDECLMRLSHEKAHLDISMVVADIKHITQFEELMLLKEFEKRETTFTSRYQTKRNERKAMILKVTVVNMLSRSSYSDVTEVLQHMYCVLRHVSGACCSTCMSMSQSMSWSILQHMHMDHVTACAWSILQ
jgi:ribosomal protein L5